MEARRSEEKKNVLRILEEIENNTLEEEDYKS